MKAATAVSVIALLASSVVASDLNPPSHDSTSPVRARLHISQSKMRREAGGHHFKRCKAHNSPSASPAAASATPAPAPEPATSSSSAAAPAPTTSAPASSSGGDGGGSSGDVIKVKTSGCGDIGATVKTTKTSGPNGSENWLNCGLENGGWKPPMIQVSDLKYKDLHEVMTSSNNIFKPCAPYLEIINDAANANGVPAILIASIMMQESTCNKDTVGGGGEQGLMQITKDKCGGAPGGNCKDPYFNINTGAKYLGQQIKDSGNNVLLAVGSYNGWHEGLTYGAATAAAKTSCCRCQNNLDYPHQFFNGWMQGIDAYSTDIGTYKNLNVCS